MIPPWDGSLAVFGTGAPALFAALPVADLHAP
jgi:hypothetical protein